MDISKVLSNIADSMEKYLKTADDLQQTQLVMAGYVREVRTVVELYSNDKSTTTEQEIKKVLASLVDPVPPRHTFKSPRLPPGRFQEPEWQEGASLVQLSGGASHGDHVPVFRELEEGTVIVSSGEVYVYSIAERKFMFSKEKTQEMIGKKL